MSRPIVVTVCMISSSESWGPQQHPHPWHFRAGGGAVHSIKSGLTQCSKSGLSLDHLVGAGEQCRRHGEAERLVSWKIDHELKLGRKLHWQIAGLGALQDLDHVVGCTAKALGNVDPITDQATVIDGLAPCVERGQSRCQCRRSNCSTLPEKQRVPQ